MTPDLAPLFAQLEAAVRLGDRARAAALQQQIADRIAALAADRDAAERRLKALMQQLALAETANAAIQSFDPLEITRGGAIDGDNVDFPVFFATNRKPDGAGGFGPERGDKTARGKAIVHIPKAHRFGETGSSFWTRLSRGDDRLRLKQTSPLDVDPFYAAVRAEIEAARAAGEAPQALVFIHGFNVSFENAAIRAAQIGYDLKVPGATAFFSWPSRGQAALYPADEATIDASERAIADFLIEFGRRCGTDKVHVIAHSMGNRGLLRALQRITADAATRGKVRFNQMILAAPDVDRGLFLDLAALYSQNAERVTLYASSADLAVNLSARLHDAPRAGYFKPYTVAAGVDTIAVPDFDVDLLGHSYFAGAEALLHDIFDLIRYGEAPNQRQRIDPVSDGGLDFWRLRV